MRMLFGISLALYSSIQYAARLTEAEEYSKERDEKHRQTVDGKSEFAQMEGTFGEVLPPCCHVGHKRDGIRQRRQHDEGTCQVDKRRRAAERDRAESRGHYRHEQSRVDWAAEALVDLAKERREWNGVVSCQGPVNARTGKDRSDATAQGSDQQDEEQTKCGTVTARRLGVYRGQRIVVAVS